MQRHERQLFFAERLHAPGAPSVGTQKEPIAAASIADQHRRGALPRGPADHVVRHRHILLQVVHQQMAVMGPKVAQVDLVGHEVLAVELDTEGEIEQPLGKAVLAKAERAILGL